MTIHYRLIVFLTGEGNFSFARVFATSLKSETTTCDNIDLIATDFVEKNDNDQHNEELDINMEQLSIDESIRKNIRELNVPVWLDLDCTQMENHKRLESKLINDQFINVLICCIFQVFCPVANTQLFLSFSTILMPKT